MKAILDEAKGSTGKTALLVLRGYRDAPAELPRLLLRKAAVFFNAFEVPDNASIYFFRDRVPLLRVLPVWPCVVGAGFVGLFAALSRGVLRRREFWFALLAVATPLAASVLVQPTSRYRVGAVAPLALGTGLLTALVWEDLAGARRRRAAALAGLAVTASLVPLLPSPLPTPATGTPTPWSTRRSSSASCRPRPPTPS
jgi:hypothetical protein